MMYIKKNEMKKLASAAKACLVLNSHTPSIYRYCSDDYKSALYYIDYRDYVCTRIEFMDTALATDFEVAVDDTRALFDYSKPKFRDVFDKTLFSDFPADGKVGDILADPNLLRMAFRFYEAVGLNVHFDGYRDMMLRVSGEDKFRKVRIDTLIATKRMV